MHNAHGSCHFADYLETILMLPVERTITCRARRVGNEHRSGCIAQLLRRIV